MDVSIVLEAFYPGTEWSCDATYDSLQWYSVDTAKPSEKELSAKYADAVAFLALRDVRVQRDALLVASDWTQTPDAPVDAKAWATYRQELRDLPATVEDPLNPVWPSKP
jgi:hypothetical protein